MEQTLSCKISEQAVQRARRRMWILALFIPIGMLVFLWASSVQANTDFSSLLCFASLMAGFVEAVIFITASTFLRRMSELALAVSAEGLERTGGRFTEKIAYAEIDAVEILSYPSGETAAVTLKRKEKKVLILHGFDCMESLVQQLEKVIPDPALIRRKKLKVDWDRPIPFIGLLILALAILVGIYLLGEELSDGLFILLRFSYGLYSLVSRPVTQKLGKQFEKFEIVIGAILVITSLAQAGVLAAEALGW